MASIVKVRSLAAALLVVLCAEAVSAQEPRQFYSSDGTLANKDRWVVFREQGYATTYYCFKPNPDDANFTLNHCYFFFKDPDHIYFQNTEKEYWGRCHRNKGRWNRYSTLPKRRRAKRLAQIPRQAFPPPGEMPPIPQSTDGTQMLPPPPPPS
jgi:hypothetical protein